MEVCTMQYNKLNPVSYTHLDVYKRQIVLGPLVGLILGDLQMGIVVGATLELAFLGQVSVGAYTVSYTHLLL